ncbi:MAG: DEAD/DEAH box helicase, partial [Curtobacterium sp.]
GSRFDPTTAGWIVTGIGEHPDRSLATAGFAVVGLGRDAFADVVSLDQLTWPVSMLSTDGRTVLVRHRLVGFEACRARIGPAAVWDKDRSLFKMPLSDLLVAGIPRAGVVWDPAAVDRAYALREASPAVPGIARQAARLALAPDRTTVEDEVRAVASVVGHYPAWWRKPPMPHQITGALAVAAGHTLLADDPGIGKTLTSLLAAAICGAKRIMIACPPKVATHWGREVAATGIAEDSQIVVIQAGKKTPALADATVVVAPYSMLTEHPSIGAQIALWQPNWIIADEAHLLKVATSRRTEAMLRLRSDLPAARCVALTGTPVMSGPHELVPLLEFTGHLTSEFGGASAFLGEFCRQDKYGSWHPNKRSLRRLNARLNDRVWVRRTKAQVLSTLPAASVERFDLLVDLDDYNRVHQDIIERVDGWLDRILEDTGAMPSDEDIAEYVDTAIEYASWLRRAAGSAKVPAVQAMILDHLRTIGEGPCQNPLLVWAHHSDVIEALCEATGAPSLTGSTSKRAADRLIDGYQAGDVPVLVCSIQAVGAGITLTRGHDAIFAEVDWTPAMMQQALDRQRRIGQLHQVRARIPLAVGTLDEHVANVLGEKASTVGAILGDDSAQMFAEEQERAKRTPAIIVKSIIRDRIVLRRQGARSSLGAPPTGPDHG